MDTSKYFEEVNRFIDNLSDEEFDDLLKESGIDNCPYEDYRKEFKTIIKDDAKRRKIKEESYISLICDLLFAYANKDEDFPHAFEVEKIEQACDLALEEYKGQKYSKKFFEVVKERVKKKQDGLQQY